MNRRPQILRISRSRMDRDTATKLAVKVRAALLQRMPQPFPTDMANACALASYAFTRVLQARNAPAVFMYGEWDTGEFARYSPVLRQHCWVELHGLIYDLTATQFGVADEVLVVRRSDPRYYECHAAGGEAIAWINKHWPLSPKRFRRAVNSTIYACRKRAAA
jgi:hypothetical protein